MSNQAELDLVRKAIASGLGGCVEWDDRVVDRVATELARHGLKIREVRKALIEASKLLNATLWWVSIQVGLRIAYGLALWLSFALRGA